MEQEFSQGGIPLPPGPGRFDALLTALSPIPSGGGGIGVQGEKTLHALLKGYCAWEGAEEEVKIAGFVADLAGEEGIVEIQTRGLGRLRKKLPVFLEQGMVTVVHPIPCRKWICWIDPETGQVSPPRKSPKTGSFLHGFRELYQLCPLLPHPRLSFRLILLDVTEYRYQDGWGRQGKKSSTRMELYPLAWQGETLLHFPRQYQDLLPQGLPPAFTSQDLCRAARLLPQEGQAVLRVMRQVGAVEQVGKQGRLFLYRRCSL